MRHRVLLPSVGVMLVVLGFLAGYLASERQHGNADRDVADLMATTGLRYAGTTYKFLATGRHDKVQELLSEQALGDALLLQTDAHQNGEMFMDPVTTCAEVRKASVSFRMAIDGVAEDANVKEALEQVLAICERQQPEPIASR